MEQTIFVGRIISIPCIAVKGILVEFLKRLILSSCIICRHHRATRRYKQIFNLVMPFASLKLRDARSLSRMLAQNI